VATSEVKKQAGENGIKWLTSLRAKKELGIISYPLQVEGKNVWFLRLPQQQ
jgi:hypothetical protein